MYKSLYLGLTLGALISNVLPSKATSQWNIFSLDTWAFECRLYFHLSFVLPTATCGPPSHSPIWLSFSPKRLQVSGIPSTHSVDSAKALYAVMDELGPELLVSLPMEESTELISNTLGSLKYLNKLP